eukprot:7871629-Prorocentrum_lima.AAC.1
MVRILWRRKLAILRSWKEQECSGKGQRNSATSAVSVNSSYDIVTGPGYQGKSKKESWTMPPWNRSRKI